MLFLAMMLPLLACTPLGTKGSGRNPKPQGPLQSYEYELVGTMAYPITYYQVERDSAGTVLIAWSADGPEIRLIKGPEDFFDKVGEIVGQYSLHRLKNSYLPRLKVLDGKMWHVCFRFERNSIQAGGSNAYPPDSLWAGISAVNLYIQSLIDASGEEDVVERRSHR